MMSTIQSETVLDPDDPEESVSEYCDENQNRISSGRILLVLDGRFFKIVKLKNKNVQAKYTQCNRIIKGRIGAMTNFLSHLKVKGHSAEEYLKYKSVQAKNPLKRPRNDNSVEEQPSLSKKPKQVLLSTEFSRSSQQTADALITSFVVETMSPMSIVEHEAFKKLIAGVNNLQSLVSVITRKILRTKIDCMFSEMLRTLLLTLEPITHRLKTPLTTAINRGDVSIIETLMDKYPVELDSTTTQPYGKSALMHASYITRNIDVLEALISRGADVRKTDIRIFERNDSQFLLDYGADAKATDSLGYSSLRLAILRKRQEQAVLWVENGSDVICVPSMSTYSDYELGEYLMPGLMPIEVKK